MAAAARVVRCRLPTGEKLDRASPRRELVNGPPRTVTIERAKGTESEGGTGTGKIMLQPRVCNLRSYGSEPVGVLKSGKGVGEGGVSPFFEILSEYIESSKKSQDFETISGRLAMIVFAVTVGREAVTGNSLFQKLDVQGLAEGAGACLGAVAFAAAFAWFSSARSKVGRMFTTGCNTLIDTLIDQIVDGLFYESELSDWSDDI
ncbi:hypothetical protein MLD38_035660 [Melastoma candidum]|uniref:Uncharacterized protein n=1 Tax=Melastoma candidum TaxID=119954 RepID=A0ACB9LGV0_9MYRT|nr:hypothetical protein MLD38_035660 [Melastoma candidum]